MSGAKRKSKFRKNLEHEMLYSTPEPSEDEQIVCAVCSRGGNILQVRDTSGVESLCRLPTKYRNCVWVKRGTYLIVSKASEDFKTSAGTAGKVVFNVQHVLFDVQIKHLKKS